MKPVSLQRFSKNKLLTNYVYYLIDFSLRIGVQMAYFIIISRALGAAAYGLFVSISAIAAFSSCFAGLGSEQTLIRRASGRPHEFPTAFGHALVCLGFSTVPIIAICTYAVEMLLPEQVSTEAVLGIVVADIFFSKLTWLANIGYLSQELARRQFVINIALSVIKLAGAALAWWLASPLSIESWAFYYCASVSFGAVLAVGLITYDLGRPRYAFYHLELGDGLQYALEMSSVVALRDFDKPLVVHVLGPEIGGLYAAAVRIVDTAAVPINALLQTTYARYFQHAREGFGKAVEFGLRVLPVGILLSLTICTLLLTTAWAVPLLLGPSYDGTVSLIRWLAVYPVVVAVFGAGSDLLRSLSSLGPRLKVVIVSALVYLPACYVGAISAGVYGAAVARSLSHSLLAALIWLVILKVRDERETEP
jgi:O-antigen/teichoic acid export membrane protein